jgi:pre-mRNA-processing factor SLU7
MRVDFVPVEHRSASDVAFSGPLQSIFSRHWLRAPAATSFAKRRSLYVASSPRPVSFRAPIMASSSSAANTAAAVPKSTAFKSREDFKKAKELEEARKAGTIAPEQDEDGNDINPHIPQYISEAPWYVPSKGPTLKHQRNLLAQERKFDKVGDWYARGERAGPAATKFRKGACENCGAMTHKRKDCLERPRAKGAKWTGTDIAADEVVRDVNLDWEGKRDRWNGYDSKNYRNIQERYAKLEAERRRLRAEKMEKDLREGKRSVAAGGSDDDEADDDDERPGGDASEVVMQQKDQATPAVVRNLRIREDTAKYLRNLDVNSAYYDPKTRSMRADPNPEIGANDKDFAGDNFVRYTGDVRELARMELHSLKATEEGRDLPHLLAEPTTAEEVFKDFASRKSAIEGQRREEILDRYGGEEHIKKNANTLGVQESESYVEYNRDGQIVSGKESVRPTSKYVEDMFENKHTSVWGSYYVDGKWGFDCCHQTSRNAYCTGEAGKRAAIELANEMAGKTEAALERRAVSARAPSDLDDRKKDADPETGKRPRGSLSEEGSDESKRRKVEAALRVQQVEEDAFETDDRRRKYNSAKVHHDATEEEMEAYRLRKRSSDDPMAKYLADKEFRRDNG